MAAPRDASGMSVEEFIGPALVGEGFWLDGRDEDHGHVWEAAAEGGLPELWRSPCGRFAVRDLDWGPEQVPSVVAEADGSPVGFYLQGQCWVDPEWRRLGLASEMILVASRLAGGSPTCNPDGLGFTEAGHAAHVKAHRLAARRADASRDTAAGPRSPGM